MNRQRKAELSVSAFDAVIFDMDGVVTQTATLHAAAWKRLFDEVLEARSKPDDAPRPFDIEEDYRRYVDGKPRYDGVASFLASRGISLPYGNPSDPSEALTVCGLGNRKNAYFWQILERGGVEVFASTIRLIERLRTAGIKTGIFTASRNGEAILSAAKVLPLFDAKVDGVDAEDLSLAGKPHPDMLLELTTRLGAVPGRTAVVEDALAGVQAGRQGGFALVIGVNRTTTPGRLLQNGADIEVTDLAELLLAT